jgi:Arc/MetJ family transcription regulator
LLHFSKTRYNRSTETTINIPEVLLRETMQNAKTEIKRDAVLTAIDDYNRRCRLQTLADRAGKSDTFMSLEELLEMRLADARELEWSKA